MIADTDQQTTARFTSRQRLRMARSRLNDQSFKQLIAYEAAETGTNRRKAPPTKLASADKLQSNAERRRLVANAQHVVRNFALAAWAIRKHLDFVSSFKYQCRNKDKAFRKDAEQFIAEKSKATNFDAARRHPRRMWFRINESMRTVVGDVFAARLNSGRMLAIEGDRVRNPTTAGSRAFNLNRDDWNHGIRINPRTGQAVEVAVHKRTAAGGFQLEAIIPARKLIQHGYFDRFDQVRGVSPLSAGLNTLLDSYEIIDYSVARAKVEQLFALKLTRKSGDPPAPATDAAGDVVDAQGNTKKKYEYDFGKGPILLDMDDDEDADFLASDHPSATWVPFLQELAGLCLKALDLPRSFAQENYSNFFGSRAALMLYLKSAAIKREDNKELHDDWSDWQFERGIAAGEIRLPRGEDSVVSVWTPDGVPWWNPLQEVKANQSAVENFFNSPQRIVSESLGADAFDIVDETKDFVEYLADAGLLAYWAPASKVTTSPRAAA